MSKLSLKKVGQAIKQSTKAVAALPKGVIKQPDRLLTGSFDPISTGLWNKVLGRNYDPLVNQVGGPTKETLDDVGANSLARGGFKAADLIAGMFGGAGAANGLGAAAGSMGIGGAGAGAGGAAGGAGGVASEGAGGIFSGGGLTDLIGPVIGGGLNYLSARQANKANEMQDPNAYLKPYLAGGAEGALAAYQNGGPELYNGSSVAPFSDQTNAALGGIFARAQNGSPLVKSAQGFVNNGLNTPVSSQFGGASNPYANSVTTGGNNPFSNPVATSGANNPFAGPVSAGQSMFGDSANPYLDANYNHAFGQAMQGVESQFARGGRNIQAARPVAGDIAANLANQIYSPAFENQANRNLSAFESAQGRQLQAGLAGQQIGAQGYENAQGRALQSGLAGQQIGAQGYESAQSRALQAGLAGQQIGAQGYESERDRMLNDLTNQRQNQLGMLGYASPLAAQDYMDLEQMRSVGQSYDTQNQARLTDEIGRFNQQANRPYANLDSYLARLGSLAGTGSNLQVQGNGAYQNPLAAGVGGALLFQQLFGGGEGKSANPTDAYNYRGGMFGGYA